MSFKHVLPFLALILAAACGTSEDPRDPPDVDPGPGPDEPMPPAAPADPFVKLTELPAACTGDRWCWKTPAPSGNDYAKVYSTAKDNIWMIGAHGVVMQWNGKEWRFHSPTQPAGHPRVGYAYAITGLGPKDMWILIGSTVQHWDGATWTIKDVLAPDGLVTFNSLWEAPNGDVWVTLSNGTVSKQVAGGIFERISTGCNCFLGSIWGTAPDNFWITTLPGNILRSDGRTFLTAYSGGTPIGSFSGTGKDDVWVTGQDGAMVHWNGTAWTPVESGLTSGFLGATAALAPDDVWWWWASNSSATSGFVHWDGRTITRTPVDTSALGVFLHSTAIIDGRWWLVGGAGAVYTRLGNDAVTPVVNPQVISLQSMWGTSIDNMYFATGGQILRSNGRTLTTMQPVVAASSISGVRTARGDELFGVGFEITEDRSAYIANAFHYDGTSWTKAQLERAPIDEHRYFTKVWALAAGEAIAVGYGGIAYYFANGTWSRILTNVTTDLMGVWGSDAEHVWLSGSQGTLLKWQRSNPTVAVSDPTLTTADDLGVIHGAGGVAWISTGDGVLKGTALGGWTKIATPFAADGLFAIDADNVVISSGAQSHLARWNGSAFVLEDNGSAAPTPVLFQPPGGPLLAGGLKTLVQHQR